MIEATHEAADVRGLGLADDQHIVDANILLAIRRQIAQNGPRPCAYYFKDVLFRCCNGVVTVDGRVPTVRLKKVLLSWIEILEGVTEMNDQLDVVSSTGLSTGRPRDR